MENVYDDINVIINNESGIGYGYVYDSVDGEFVFGGTIYQSRLNQEMLDNGDNFHDIIDDLANTSKAYCIDENDLTNAVNEILDFYFEDRVTDDFVVAKEKTIQSAVKHLIDNNLKHYIFRI